MPTKTNAPKSPAGSIIIIAALFFIFGFITWLNATLIPYLKISCELNNLESFFVAFAFYISYFVMALPSSWILKKTGFKKGMSLGLLVMALGSLLFIPAANSRTYLLFLGGLFIQGTGLAILQTAANPYVTILGPIESAAKRISIMGIANKVAGILSPLILGSIVLSGIDDLIERLDSMDVIQKANELNLLASRVITPYSIMAAVLLFLGLAILFSKLPEINEDEESESELKNENHPKSLFQHTYLVLGVLAIFLYVGIEVIAVDTLIGYGNWLGFEFSEARFFASFTMFAMVIGYIFGIISIPKYITQDKALKYFAILGSLMVTFSVFTNGYASILAIAALGFANSIMWPAIWPLAIEGLGKHTKTGSALLIMGIAGGALLPLLYGYLSDLESIGNQNAYLIMLPAYLYILFYATKGHRINKKQVN